MDPKTRGWPVEDFVILVEPIMWRWSLCFSALTVVDHEWWPLCRSVSHALLTHILLISDVWGGWFIPVHVHRLSSKAKRNYPGPQCTGLASASVTCNSQMSVACCKRPGILAIASFFGLSLTCLFVSMHLVLVWALAANLQVSSAVFRQREQESQRQEWPALMWCIWRWMVCGQASCQASGQRAVGSWSSLQGRMARAERDQTIGDVEDVSAGVRIWEHGWPGSSRGVWRFSDAAELKWEVPSTVLENRWFQNWLWVMGLGSLHIGTLLFERTCLHP